MSETIEGEFEVYQAYREAGIGYIDLMNSAAATPTALVEARNRFMSARTDWTLRTVQAALA